MITLERSFDEIEIGKILFDDEIFSRIAEDDVEEFEIDAQSDCYLIIRHDDVTIGVWCVYPANRTTLNIHCNILKLYRKHGVEAGWKVLRWFKEESPEMYQKLNCEIPMIFPDVYHFTKMDAADRREVPQGPAD